MMSVRPVGAVRPHASLGKRFLAYVLDSAAAMLLAGGFLFPAALALTRGVENLEAVPVWALVLVVAGNLLLLALGIFQWWYQGTRGFTIGKLVLKIRTVDAVSGTPAGMGRILLRQLILGIGSILVALSTVFDGQGRNRGWHDLAAKTVVIDCAGAATKYSAPHRRQGYDDGQAWQTPAPQSPTEPTPPLAPVHTRQSRPVPAPEGPASTPAPAVSAAPVRRPALPAYLVNENNAASAGAPPARSAAPAPSAPLAPSAPPPAPQEEPIPVAQPVAAADQSEQPTATPAESAPAVSAQRSTEAPQPGHPHGHADVAAQRGPVIQAAPGFEGRQDRNSPQLPDDVEMTGIPPSATLNFSDGKRVTLTETVLIGRNPRPSPNEVVGELIRVSDPGRSVSKTHVLIGVDGDGVWVADRASTNGTIVTLADEQQILCSSHQVVRLPKGAVVSFGDYSIDFEYRND